MPGIPNETIQTILEKADIESVVGEYVQFTKRSGNNLFGLCPFHNEKTPSFSVNTTKGFYHCFGCQKSGNSIGFIMELEKMSFVEAVKYLGKKYGVEIIEDSNYRKDDSSKKKERVKKLLVEAAKFYYKAFIGPEGKTARAYTSKRAMTPAGLKSFGVGYAPEGWDNLYIHMQNLGFSDEEMSNSGLFTVSRKTGKLIDLLRNRLVFPIFNVYGEVIAFGGRVLDDSLPKYVNSPDSLVYKKKEHLYALNFAKKDRTGRLIVVEGYMDAFAMHQAGVCNAVASLGTAFTDSQLRLASKYANEIIFFFDADNAGQNAAISAIQKMMSYLKKMSGIQMRIRIAKVPDGKDPDEFIRNNGAEAFQKVINDAKDVETYLSDKAYDDNYNNGDKEGKPGLDLFNYQKDIVKYASWISDEIVRSRMATKAAFLLSAKSDILLEKINSAYDENEKQTSVLDKRQSYIDSEKEVKERNENIAAEEENNDVIEEEPVNDNTPKSEIVLFALAVALRENLADSSFIALEDVIRPKDFNSRNMQAIVTFFLNNFDVENGINEAFLINEMSKYTLNGYPAENVYISAAEKIDKDKDYKTIRGMYLSLLYKIRLNSLMKYKRHLIESLDQLPSDDREEVNNKLRKIDEKIEYIRHRSASIE